MKNPFKFGSVVDGRHFANRREEIKQVKSILNSENHLILISPRRFGKTSLVYNVTRKLRRPVLHLNLQMVTSPEDFARQLVNRIFRLFPFERIKEYIKNFRIVPVLKFHPASGETHISFSTGFADDRDAAIIEDAFYLLERVASGKKIVAVFDEFQEILRLDNTLPAVMRSVMQHHKNVNYVLLGSQESLMREMFERKKSPFYHFGMVMYLDKIPEAEFRKFVAKGLEGVSSEPGNAAAQILGVSRSHPYYTQQLAYRVWELMNSREGAKQMAEGQIGDGTMAKGKIGEGQMAVDQAVDELVMMHDIDYERLWHTFNNTDKKVLVGLSESRREPLSAEFTHKIGIASTSTVFSSLKRLQTDGIVIKQKSDYEIDDPFFSRWINSKRQQIDVRP